MKRNAYFQYTQHSLPVLGHETGYLIRQSRDETDEDSKLDSPRRSLLKAILWQVMGLLSMVLIGMAVTGSVRAGGVIAGLNALLGLVSYLLYERAWNRVSWGRVVGKSGNRQ